MKKSKTIFLYSGGQNDCRFKKLNRTMTGASNLDPDPSQSILRKVGKLRWQICCPCKGKPGETCGWRCRRSERTLVEKNLGNGLTRKREELLQVPQRVNNYIFSKISKSGQKQHFTHFIPCWVQNECFALFFEAETTLCLSDLSGALINLDATILMTIKTLISLLLQPWTMCPSVCLRVFSMSKNR